MTNDEDEPLFQIVFEIMENFDDLYQAGLFEEASQYMQTFSFEDESLTILVSVATMTSRNMIGQKMPGRKVFMDKLYYKAMAQGEDADELLQGLVFKDDI